MLEYIKFASAALLNVALAIAVYFLEKGTKFGKIKYAYKQIIIGLAFGCASVFASNFGVKIWGTTMNVRDAAPITASLLFGSISGVLSGFIGGAFRALTVIWNPSSSFTVVACSISTLVAGIVAALLRKFMFDDKKSNWIWAICITIVLEIFHMLMIMITNMKDSYDAFLFVRQCTIPMILANVLSVGLSVIIISILSKEKLFKVGKDKGIAQAFQRWLILSILIAFAITSVFTFNLQTGIRKTQIEKTFETSISDVIHDIKGKSNQNLLNITKEVKEEYLKDVSVSVADLLALPNFSGKITDINLIASDGKVVCSTDQRNLEKGGYNLNVGAQSKEFMVLMNKGEDEFLVQGYQANGFDEMRKYAGITLPSDDTVPENLRGGIIQVSYNSTQFHDNLDGFVIDFTKNRHVGTNGFIAVCDEELRLVTETVRDNMHISVIGIEPNQEMLNRVPSKMIYQTNIVNSETNYNEKYLYVFTFAEGYCIIATIPQSEAMFLRDASIYLSVFMQVIIFGVLFIVLYFLIKKLVIDNIHKINGSLSKISSGNLNETVDVRSNVEFASLSDDINTTVDTLKRYIKEAAARIDKELEYAKQIQTSALPNDFPKENDYEIYAKMIAAKEVGGDFYDFYKLNDNLVAFLVADVSGKGIPAAMFMMTAKTIIKDLAERGLAVNDIFTIANQKLCENNESGMFVTAWMGILNTKTGKLTYANAGHNPPLIYTKDRSNEQKDVKERKFEYLKSKAGLVLAGMDQIKYRLNELTLNKGDKILLYTDGVTEATNPNNQLYGEDRLIEFMNKNAALSPTNVLHELKKDIDLFVGDAPQFDDITMLVFDYKDQSESLNDQKVFDAKIDSLSQVISFLEQNLEIYACPMKTTMALCVAIEEVFVNVANYAYEDGTGKVKFFISYNVKDGTATFIMKDSGKPFNPLEREDPDLTLSAEQRQIGGLGIFITKKTMDKVSYRYENGENILTMIKKLTKGD